MVDPEEPLTYPDADTAVDVVEAGFAEVAAAVREAGERLAAAIVDAARVQAGVARSPDSGLTALEESRSRAGTLRRSLTTWKWVGV